MFKDKLVANAGRAIQLCWLVLVVIFFIRFLSYLAGVLQFPFDWEPTDGDHLNFALRIHQGLPVFLPLKDGFVLSIYNPLFHTLLGFFGGLPPMSLMVLGRLFAIISWLGCGVIAFLHYKNRLALKDAAIVASFFLLPNLQSAVLEIVNVSPNSLMVFLFLASMFVTERCLENKDSKASAWIAAGILCAACFFAKQQGIIALASCGTTMLVHRVPFKRILLFSLSVGLVGLCGILYLEHANAGYYLQTVIFDLSKIMIWSRDLAFTRHDHFMIQNLAFTICVLTSLWFAIKSRRRWTLWQIAVVLHLPLLYKTLGNGGGGPNYFLTYWFCYVACAVDFIYRSQELSSRARAVFVSLFLINTGAATITAHFGFNDTYEITESLKSSTAESFAEIRKVVAELGSPKVLAYRNVGVLLNAGLTVDVEGSTQFSYAWAHDAFFNKEPLLAALRKGEYDLVFRGLVAYPADVQAEIDRSYEPFLNLKMNFIYGAPGTMVVYRRKN